MKLTGERLMQVTDMTLSNKLLLSVGSDKLPASVFYLPNFYCPGNVCGRLLLYMLTSKCAFPSLPSKAGAAALRGAVAHPWWWDSIFGSFLWLVWLATQNHSTLVTETTVVPFLPVNPEYSSTRNQASGWVCRVTGSDLLRIADILVFFFPKTGISNFFDWFKC